MFCYKTYRERNSVEHFPLRQCSNFTTKLAVESNTCKQTENKKYLSLKMTEITRKLEIFFHLKAEKFLKEKRTATGTFEDKDTLKTALDLNTVGGENFVNVIIR